jgi:hypothetical protein
MTVLGHERGEDAFAQAAVGNPQALAGPGSEQRLEDGTAREHKISSLVTDAGLSHAFGVAHANEVVRHGAHVSRREPAAVDTSALIDRQLEVNA